MTILEQERKHLHFAHLHVIVIDAVGERYSIVGKTESGLEKKRV